MYKTEHIPILGHSFLANVTRLNCLSDGFANRGVCNDAGSNGQGISWTGADMFSAMSPVSNRASVIYQDGSGDIQNRGEYSPECHPPQSDNQELCWRVPFDLVAKRHQFGISDTYNTILPR
ncbi:hypothetical protein TNCV_3481551 [Trichonephila clavipes]|nr:hypothetical protein TNCV_3481551 [Trichonephila clavipes]